MLEKPRSKNKGIALKAMPAIAIHAINSAPGCWINQSEKKLIGTRIKNVHMRTHSGIFKKLFQISEKKAIVIVSLKINLCTYFR